MEGIRGGHIEHGLLMGLASSGGCELLSSYGGSLSYAEQVVANAVLGGVVSELGGGKFANGAMTAAYTMMFNDLAHKSKRIVKTYKKKYIGQVPLDEKVGMQNAVYIIDTSVITTFNSGIASIEICGIGMNSYVDGSVSGAFEALLVLDGVIYGKVSLIKHFNNYITDNSINTNFIGEAYFNNININRYTSVNVIVQGNWVVKDSSGAGCSVPISLFSKLPIYHKHNYKIK